ncbi:MAG: hypothetical protein AOA66_1412 [Candidatus Bathyarchaeota archaeon BA2]|nr:MAG: hypothetical protein AOA66_1412 [Candidatus Bathyarchaeota archaeon BA2]
MWTITSFQLRRNRRGASNIIVVVLSLVIIVIIVSNIVLFSYEMNQLDWEKMKEAMSITNVERATRSSWFVAQSEYTVNTGSRTSGTYTDTQAVDDQYERFMEASTTSPYNPSGYTLVESTSWVSGSVSDLTSDNGVYMVFRSYATDTVGQTLYAHQETTIIGGATYRLQKLESADTAGISISVSGALVGRELVGKFVYPLTGISSIPASTWTIYYRAIKDPLMVAHADVDILIRQADGTVRASIATNVADSKGITTSWKTLFGTYVWSTYTVLDQTDYLEIDYYIHLTISSPAETASLRIDDNTLAIADQTRATNIMLPSEFTAEVEFTGTSNTATWTQLVWTVDSCWTTANVNVTLQLYNYNSGSYPTSGDGYISYTSSATPNTDETKTQTIVTNSTYFRDGSGNWKIKVKGVKTTTTQFDFKADWIEFKTTTADYYTLDVDGTFTIDISTYPFAYIQTIEIQLRYSANDAGEKWYLKAYNWTASTYSDSGFNSTAGHTPTIGWDYYAVNLTDKWRSYVRDNGTIYVKVVDEGGDSNQTTVDIDFLGVRAEIDGTRFTFKNEGALTSHLVSLWIIDSTNHRRYDINIFVNSADTTTYIRADVSLPAGQFTVKVVTERGNIAVSGS